ncbi:hypothetical protein [Prosthecobacter sp.]|uniref:hypothetical protein n=1 Tax=Prosthecobacter sp. TaxID=1965333 RepID=UPI00260DA9FF|nr:hypothetical protein [Prosthecobacter sp.]
MALMLNRAARKKRIFPTLLLALTLHLAAAEAPAHQDAAMTSPSGKLHLRLSDPTTLPGTPTPGKEGEENATQTPVLEEQGRPPFHLTAPEGRITPHWSDDEAYLALAIQTDRAHFSLLILRLSDRTSITCDFTPVGQAWAKRLDNARLTDQEKLAAAIGPSQLLNVRCTAQQCTGTVVCGSARFTGAFSFDIDLTQQEWTLDGTLVQARVTASELKLKE